MSIKGNVAGAGEKGTVSALRGGQAEISISGGAAPARTVRVPLDYLERVTAASR